jgi:hypothetical protein
MAIQSTSKAAPQSRVSKQAKLTAKPARVTTTLRLEPELRHGLEVLQVALGTPLNKLVNMAVARFVAAKSADIESELEAALSRIKALRRADPTFAQDFKDIVSAEVKHRRQDPVEGKAFRRNGSASAVSMVRRVVSAV